MSEGIDVNETTDLFECNICHYWYSAEINFKLQPIVCNDCPDKMQKTMNFNDVTIFFVKRNDYRNHFWYVSKEEGVNLLINADLTEKRGKFENIIFLYCV